MATLEAFWYTPQSLLLLVTARVTQLLMCTVMVPNNQYYRISMLETADSFKAWNYYAMRNLKTVMSREQKSVDEHRD